VDEIKLFERLEPPLPPDAAGIREAARDRLSAAMSTPHQARRRRSSVVAVAAAAVLVAAGATYGLAAGDHPAPRPAGSPVRSTAGLAAVSGCPRTYVAAGTLEHVNGAILTVRIAEVQVGNDRHRYSDVAVRTYPSTVITGPVRAAVGAITDGSIVTVQGIWSGSVFTATEVAFQEPSPVAGYYAAKPWPARARRWWIRGGTLTGIVAGALDGRFTVRTTTPSAPRLWTPVVTTASTKVVAAGRISSGRLDRGANVVVVGHLGPDAELAAEAVTEPVPGGDYTAGVQNLGSSGCSASAITAAVIAAG
jgi:hypothetical protein